MAHVGIETQNTCYITPTHNKNISRFIFFKFIFIVFSFKINVDNKSKRGVEKNIEFWVGRKTRRVEGAIITAYLIT